MTPIQVTGAVLSLTILHSVLSSCPSNAVHDVFRCLANLTIGLHDENVKAGEDVDVVRRHCQSGEFETSAKCVESLFAACQHTQQITLLYKLVDPDRIRHSFNNICGDLDLYSDSKRCIMEQDVIIKRCFRVIEHLFNTNIEKAKYVNHVIFTYCGFQLGLRECIVGPVGNACGPKIGRLMNDFMNGVTAPICHQMAASSASSLFFTNHPALLFLSLTLLVLSALY